ncbi:MAG: Plug domain-containing protein [Gemmatimonadetes bacterium]|nr:Plug domain-containing protein [Gemmatimonadota bacterium]
MMPCRGGARPRPRRCFGLAFLLLLALPVPAWTQVRPDTVAADTAARDTILVPIPPTAVSADTLPSDSLRRTARDSVQATPFPSYPSPLPIGWGAGRWEWDRAALWRYHGYSLLEFLERTPGFTVVRAGDHGQPVGITALGLGGGRLRVFIDGFEIDPLGYTSVDLQQVGTADLESVRIERDLSGIRIELSSIRAPESRPFSAVEAGTGVWEAKLLRGVLVRGVGGRSVITASYDAVTTEGYRFDAPFSMVAARAAWSYAVSERTGLQLEIRNSGVERLEGAYNENYDRRTILLRGRSRIRDGLVVDGALGRAWRKPATDDFLATDLASVQGMLRASYTRGITWGEALVRVRDDALTSSASPRLELATRAIFRPLPWASAESELRTSRLGDAGALVWRATGRAGRTGAPTVFLSLAGGAQGVGLVADEDSIPQFSSISSTVAAVRIGAEITRNVFSAGLAGVNVAGARIAPFGAAFDRGLPARDADAARGLEAHASGVLPRTGEFLRAEGWVSYWPTGGDRPYLPELDARAALTANGLFYDGQLEPSASFQVARRGSMLVPQGQAGAEYVSTTPYTLTNLFLQIRILDIQAFGLWENLLNYQSAADLPGRPLPGQRLIYGIRWVFRD